MIENKNYNKDTYLRPYLNNENYHIDNIDNDDFISLVDYVKNGNFKENEINNFRSIFDRKVENLNSSSFFIKVISKFNGLEHSIKVARKILQKGMQETTSENPPSIVPAPKELASGKTTENSFTFSTSYSEEFVLKPISDEDWKYINEKYIHNIGSPIPEESVIEKAKSLFQSIFRSIRL